MLLIDGYVRLKRVVEFGVIIMGLSLAAANAQSPYDNAQPGSAFAATRQVAVGTPVKVVLLDPVSSDRSQIGDLVRAKVAPDDDSGVPKSVIFFGHVGRVKPASNSTPGEIGIRFDNIGAVGNWSATAPPVQNATAQASAHFYGGNAAQGSSKDVAIGAGLGAIIGGSRKRKLGDTIEGGLLGALGGYAVQKATTHSASDVEIKPGSETTVTLKRPITIKTELIAS